MEGLLHLIAIIGFAAAPIVLIAAVIGAVLAATFGRRRLAMAFFVIAAVSIALPLVALLLTAPIGV
jgi:hypothetical protein